MGRKLQNVYIHDQRDKIRHFIHKQGNNPIIKRNIQRTKHREIKSMAAKIPHDG